MSEEQKKPWGGEPLNTSVNAVKEPGLPIKIPLSIVRWAGYSICFMVLLIPFVADTRQLACGGLILGWFASLLNAIANKTP